MNEIQKIIFQFEGRQKLEELTAMLGKESAIMADLVERHKQGVLTSAQYAQQAKTTASAVGGYVHQIEALDKQLKAAAIVSGRPAAQRAQGIQQLGYAVQDFVSTSGGMAQKFNSVTNNLQMLAAGFMPAGWGFVAITGFMAAIQVLFNNSDAIADWFNGIDAEKLKAQAKRVKELEKKSKELDAALETARKEEAESGRDAGSATAAKEAVERAGGTDKVVDELAGKYTGESAVMIVARRAHQDAAARKAAADKELAAIGPGNQMNWQARLLAKQRADAAGKALNEAEAGLGKAMEDVRAKAVDVVTKARQGDQEAIDKLVRDLPGKGFEKTTRDAVNKEERNQKEAEAYRESEGAAEEQRLKDLKHIQGVRGRLADAKQEDVENAKSTPEELRQSAAIEYIQRMFPKLKLSDKDWLNTADAALENLNADPAMTREQAARMAVEGATAPQRRIVRDAGLDEIKSRIDYDTGGQLAPDDLDAVAKRTQGWMAAGANPMQAFDAAMQEQMRINADLSAKLMQLQAGGENWANRLRNQHQMMAPMMQTQPTLLRVGGG